MRYQPKTQKQLDDERIMTEGEYSYQISDACNYTAKSSGKESIKLTVRVYKPDGKFNLVDDYLMEAMLFKLLHLCESAGLMTEYETGDLDPKLFIGKTGMLKLTIQPGTGGFSDRNSIKDYIVDGKADIPKDGLEEAVSDLGSDEIPF